MKARSRVCRNLVREEKKHTLMLVIPNGESTEKEALSHETRNGGRKQQRKKRRKPRRFG